MPDWPKIIDDIQNRGYALEAIAKECGFASRGALHDLKNARQPTTTYERGVALMRMHKRAMRQSLKSD